MLLVLQWPSEVYITRGMYDIVGEPERVHVQNVVQLHAQDCHQSCRLKIRWVCGRNTLKHSHCLCCHVLAPIGVAIKEVGLLVVSVTVVAIQEVYCS